MIDLDELIPQLRERTRNHAHLAVIVCVVPVAEMHLELALLSAEQVRAAERVLKDRAAVP